MSARDQIHIRDAETVALVRALARQTGRTMAGVVREAVQAYAPPPLGTSPEGRGEALARALARDRAALAGIGDGHATAGAVFEIEDLYDEGGLPR